MKRLVVTATDDAGEVWVAKTPLLPNSDVPTVSRLASRDVELSVRDAGREPVSVTTAVEDVPSPFTPTPARTTPAAAPRTPDRVGRYSAGRLTWD